MADVMELDMVGGVEMERERTGGIILNEGRSTRDFISDIVKSMTRLSTEVRLMSTRYARLTNDYFHWLMLAS